VLEAKVPAPFNPSVFNPSNATPSISPFYAESTALKKLGVNQLSAGVTIVSHASAASLAVVGCVLPGHSFK